MVRSRSRSRSPRRDRRRSRSRDQERRHRHRRSRSRSPVHRRRRSRSPSHGTKSRSPEPIIIISDRAPLDAAEMEGKTEEEIDMMKLMGFSGFNSTKGKQVQGNQTYAANIVHKRKYRQYMNRRGGFNRPLDFIA